MSFVTTILTSILGGFLTFSFFLADLIERYVPFAAPQTHPTQLAQHDDELAPLPSTYPGQVPSVLLDSLQFQQAAVTDTRTIPITYAQDPREALVNIYCTYSTERSIRTTTGTGFFINDNGVILTNAHVAQFLLLETISDIGETNCIIRTGDPAQDRFRAELLYLPPAWIQAHASTIVADVAFGTGERDYALLYVTESITRKPLPARFPALPIHTAPLTRSTLNQPIVVAGYPATSGSLDEIRFSLRPRRAETSVSNLYTFGSNLADLFSLRGSAVGEHGSSGGPALDRNGDVIGMITTRGDDTADGTGSLRAITISHIDRTIQEETGFDLLQSTRGDLPFRAHIFTTTLGSFLANILAREVRNWEASL